MCLSDTFFFLKIQDDATPQRLADAAEAWLTAPLVSESSSPQPHSTAFAPWQGSGPSGIAAAHSPFGRLPVPEGGEHSLEGLKGRPVEAASVLSHCGRLGVAPVALQAACDRLGELL